MRRVSNPGASREICHPFGCAGRRLAHSCRGAVRAAGAAVHLPGHGAHREERHRGYHHRRRGGHATGAHAHAARDRRARRRCRHRLGRSAARRRGARRLPPHRHRPRRRQDRAEEARAVTPARACAAAALLLLAGGCQRPLKPGDPVGGLSRAEQDRFAHGKVVFDSIFTPEKGLGPLFNSTSCGECHEDPAKGGRGDEVELHATAFKGGVCDPLVEEGGFVIQRHTTPALKQALGIDSEPFPPSATARALRTTPVVFGRGLLDAVPESVILAYADPDDKNHDGISGRPNRFTDGRLGRFGRKGFVPALDEFNAGAFSAEMGVTNPAVRTEETVGGKPIPAGVDPVPEAESCSPRSGAPLATCRPCRQVTARSPPCGTRSSPPTPTCCSTTWAPISPTSAWAWRPRPSSAPSRCSTSGTPRRSCTMGGTRHSVRRSRRTAARRPAPATGSRPCPQPTEPP